MNTAVALPPQTQSDDYYIDIALNDTSFQQTQASAAIEGIQFSNELLVEAGKFAAGLIDYDQWCASIAKRNNITPHFA